MVWGADVHAPAATLFTSGPARVPDNQLVITFDTPKVAAYDNSRVEVSKSPTGIFGILGVGGPRYNLPTDPSEGPPRQTGYVVLSAEYFAGVNATLRDDLTLHEIGHTFGLDHVDDVTQVMFPDIVAAATDPLPHYGAGDAAGLRLLRSHSLTGC